MSATGTTVVADKRIVEEIPNAMMKLGSFIVRAFYAPEHMMVFDFVKRNGTIKEEALRELTHFDAKQLRTVLIALKNDKLLKERQVVEARADGKQGRSNYYFVNYPALLNVTKYKLDHMRQRLESRDKEETHKANYKCAGCQSSYDALQVDRLIDIETGNLKCWRCGALVEEDEKAGPTEVTRTSLARFNEQLAPLFALLRELDGVQLAPHLTEPNMALAVRESTWVGADAQQGDAGGKEGGGRFAPLGGARYGPQFDLYKAGQEVSVHIEGDTGNSASSSDAAAGPKALPAWMAQSTVLGLPQQQQQQQQQSAASAASSSSQFVSAASESALAAAGIAGSSPLMTSVASAAASAAGTAAASTSDTAAAAPPAVVQVDTVAEAVAMRDEVDAKADAPLVSPSSGAGGAARDIAAVLLAHESNKSPTASAPPTLDKADLSRGASQPTVGGGSVGHASANDNSDNEFEEVEPECYVRGVPYTLTELMQRPDLVEDMTETEKQEYVKTFEKEAMAMA